MHFIERHWNRTLVLTCIALAVVMQIPQLLHQMHPLSQGRMVELNDDEPDYYARVQEALIGTPELAADGFTGDPEVQGMHFAFIESLYGRALSWTGWSAPEVLQLMDSIMPVLLILSLIAFFRLCGFSRQRSYVGFLIFLLVSLYYLNRPINQRAPTLFLMLALISIILALDRHVLFAVLAGVLLAKLFDIYFWSWTFGWAWFGLLVLWEGWSYWKAPEESKKQKQKRFLILVGIGCIALIAAIPFFLHLHEMMQHPLYEVSVFRAGIRESHLPVSWPYSILFLGMAIGAALWLWKKDEHKRPYAPIMVITGFVVLNQQIVHGMEFRTTSQYLFPLIISALTGLLLFYKKTWNPKWLLIPFLCAAIFLSGKLYDNRRVTRQWIVREGVLDTQYLMESLPALRNIPRSRIAAPNGPLNFIAAYTHHDVVYSIFLKNVLVSNTEIAERFCVSHIALIPHVLDIEGMSLIYPDVHRATGDPVWRERELARVKNACDRVAQNPTAYLEKYDVDYIFWDQKAHPSAHLERYGRLDRVAGGDTWSLWSAK